MRTELDAVSRAVAGSIEWANGLDLSYDTLYVEGRSLCTAAKAAEQTNPADAR